MKIKDENQRRGLTLTVKWPLWKEGGMRADKETEKIRSEDEIISYSVQSFGSVLVQWAIPLSIGIFPFAIELRRS